MQTVHRIHSHENAEIYKLGILLLEFMQDNNHVSYCNCEEDGLNFDKFNPLLPHLGIESSDLLCVWDEVGTAFLKKYANELDELPILLNTTRVIILR